MVEKMKISELAKLAGVTPRTIRYYENLGLLEASEREGTGFRYYTDDELIDLLQKSDVKCERELVQAEKYGLRNS